MPARLTLTLLLLVGAACSAASASRKVYVVDWADATEGSAERRALVAQADRQLRAELQRCGSVIEGQSARAIVLKPSLEIFPSALKLSLMGLRNQKLLGTVSMKAAGSNREAQLRAIVSRACIEADSFD
jgi:hypothetical protein